MVINNLPVYLVFFTALLTTFARGFFDWRSAAILVLVYVLLVCQFLAGKKLPVALPGASQLNLLLLVLFSFFLFFIGGKDETRAVPAYLLIFFSLFTFLLLLSFIFDFKKIPPLLVRWRFIIFLVLAMVMRLLMLAATPQPNIDLFYALKISAVSLLHGQNPYQAEYTRTEPDSPVHFNYWPVTFLAQVPLASVGADPRLLFVFTDLACAVLLYYLGRQTKAAEIISFIYLFRPNANFIIEQAWLSSLEFLLIILAIYAALKKPRAWLYGLSLGLLAATKAYYLMLIPFAFALFPKKEAMKSLLVFIAVLVAIVAPFFWWNPRSFIAETILINVSRQGDVTPATNPPFHIALNLNNVYYNITGRDAPSILMPLLTLGALIFILDQLASRPQKSVPDAVLGMALLLFTFYLFYKGPFINYYWVGTDLILLWLVLLYREKHDNLT